VSRPVCDQRNGSTEFIARRARWPFGLRHYIEVHHIKPPDTFIQYIEKLAEKC